MSPAEWSVLVPSSNSLWTAPLHSATGSLSGLFTTAPYAVCTCGNPWKSHVLAGTWDFHGFRTKFAERAFSFFGPAEWNCLSNDLRMITDTNVFKKKLKAYFYKQAFGVAKLLL